MSEFAQIKAAIDQTADVFQTFTKGADERHAALLERVEGLEAKRQHPGRTGSADASIGAQAAAMFIDDNELLQKTGKLRIEVKASSDPITTSEARSVLWGGLGMPTGSAIGIHTGLPQRRVDGGTIIEYSRYSTLQGAAAQQTEGSAKASVKPDFSIVSQATLTIAAWTKMSRQALQDRGEISAAVNVTLRRSLDVALDVALVNGATGFTGGLEGLATAYTSLVYQAMPDAISEGVATMQTAGFSPDVVALNPATWLAAVVAKGSTNDHYLSGNYLGALPQEMRGLRVVLSPSVDAGKALLMDTSHVELVLVGGYVFEAAYAGSDFTSNLVTMLGEVRVAPVYRAAGAGRFITPKP